MKNSPKKISGLTRVWNKFMEQSDPQIRATYVMSIFALGIALALYFLK
jgi:hypothetical protein